VRVRPVFALLALVLLGVLGYGLWQLRIAAGVGTGYAARVTCSLVFNSGLDPEWVLRDYVAHEVSPLDAVLATRVERETRAVEASSLGVVRARAIHRPGLGCTRLAGRSEEALRAETPDLPPRPPPPADRPWPRGSAAPATPPPPAVAEALERAFAEPGAPGAARRQTLAVLVAHRGRLVAERYAHGAGPATPLLSWSMAKSVLAALVAVAEADGLLDRRAPAPVSAWRDPDDPRSAITLDQLLRQSSGLAFDERYGPWNDATRMLFLRADMGAYAASFPLAHPPDGVWSYSSGTSNILARILRDTLGGELEARVRYARERLFDPADMRTAFFEPDASGSFVGSSFVFASARDWARFGQLHLQDGRWAGSRILPEGWVEYATTPTPASGGRYGAHWWLNAADPEGASPRMWPSLPPEVYAARGHSGQYLVVDPTAELVVVRLGLSQSEAVDEGVEELVGAVRRALAGAPGDEDSR